MTARPASSMRMSMSQAVRPSGWQKGMSSCVRLAAITPAMTAVCTIGPFGPESERSRNCAATASGNAIRERAVARLSVGTFAPTSTICGRSSAPTWESVRSAAAEAMPCAGATAPIR